MSKTKQVVVIGGGITGLTAAYYLQKTIQQENLPIQIKLLEAGPKLGGKIQTERKDGFVIERGPDSFLARKQSASRLARELGLEDQLVRNATGKSYILANSRLHEMPKGAFMGIPTEVTPFLVSSLFSVRGKLRAGLDFILPKGEPKEDQSLGAFFRRRLGDEVVENLIEPLLSGIYAGDIDQLSLMATFPNFYHLEQKHRSLVKGLKKTVSKQKSGSGKKQGMFLTLKSGLETMVEALERQLGPGSVHKETPVDHIEKGADGYHVFLKGGDRLYADSIILAVPHNHAQKIFSQYDFMHMFKEQPATSVANVAMAFDDKDIKKDIDGTGFVVSRNSDYRITACTWTHKKWPHTTPDGHALLRCYVGRPGDEEVVDLPDEEMENIVLKDLNKTMNITARPAFRVITRWKDAMPQYTVGHKQRVNTVKENMKTYLPGIFLSGSSYEGLGVPDCIDQGEQAAGYVLDFLNKK
ncbi:oxygen-dependent protoporphyrinogen oxidase [Melghiribacillus thermohalophilus]|uniref:Coproporphyrinogen III oxidase n=1 Tax=Melghiribacillus thermohalophilus TaxID=1324956 RepID=A0A4R3N6D7_9BACI|nr:protoporphyrinogen oxidase [Melghiribacillus thermohalophilus]TCT23686.1 oxygen-dependent protoporphyrinogen oxidase [Melghiribacillus thermohalophilus]